MQLPWELAARNERNMYLQSPPPPFPFLLFLFSMVSFLPPPFSDASLQQYTDCSPVPFTCGDLSANISYPFRLDGRPDYCGYPGFELKCTNNSAMIIRINSKRYQVKGVDYSNRLLTIVDPDFTGQSCPQPYENTTLDLHRFEYSDRDRNLTVFLNCSSPMLYSIDCLVNDTAGTGLRSYYGIQNGSLAGLGGICRSTVLVPVTQAAAGLLMKGNLSFGGALQEGFTVSWTAGRAWCGECVDSGGLCGFYSNSTSDRPCFCPNDLASGSCSAVGRNSRNKGIIIGTSACIRGLVLACLLFCCCRFWYKRLLKSIFFWKKKSDNAENIEAFLERYGSFAPKRFKYSDVKKITKSFRDKLGQGGNGTVFKGSLDNGCLVAVKILSSFKGNGEEFINEIASIGKTSHVNIVSLLGFCSEGSKRALIFEFMPNGSLEKYIYSEIPETTLGLEKMYHIATGIARGLEYLHGGCNTRIVHFDIKPHNILLDQEFCPKISDFGLAKLCPPKASILSMAAARGTVGYIAPEVFSRNFGVVSSKSDVYSYGMMVLEMVGCKKHIDDGGGNTSEIYFPQWIYEHLDQHRDLRFCGVTRETEEIARKMILVGLWCIQTRPENRPSMSKVAEMLQGSVDDLSMPPKPYLFPPSGSPIASSLELTS